MISVTPDRRRPLLLYTDAAFQSKQRYAQQDEQCAFTQWQKLRGGLGAVLFDPEDGSVRYASARPPWRLLLRFFQPNLKTYIAQLETLAAVCAYYTWPDVFRGRRVNHFIDNTVALSVLIHGYASKSDLALLSNAFHLQLAGLRTTAYLEYVPSKANIADLPSREGFYELHAELDGLSVLDDDAHQLLIPDVAESNQPLATWIRRNTLASTQDARD